MFTRLVLLMLAIAIFPFFPLKLEANSTQTKPAPKTQAVESKVLDQRALVLRDYFAKYDSPLQNHAQDFVDAADSNDMDWKLVPAITGVESTFGKNIPGGHDPAFTSYNGWGWGVYGNNVKKFDSWKDGILTVSNGIKQNYINKGLDDPYEMNRVYAASKTWGVRVDYFLTDLNKYEKNYKDPSAPVVNHVNVDSKTAGSSARLKNNSLAYAL